MNPDFRKDGAVGAERAGAVGRTARDSGIGNGEV